MPARALDQLAGRLRRSVAAAAFADAPDPDLLARIRDGRDPVAFEAVVRRHGRLVLAACRKVLADPADADDAFQATFLALLNNPAAVRNARSLGSWLYGVAHRTALKARAACRRRDKLHRTAGSRKSCSPAPPADADLSWREAVAVLHEELDKLPDAYRLPLLLCYLEGLTRDEAAARLGCRPDVLRGRLDRGRERLRRGLTRRGVTLSAGLLAAVAGDSAAAGGPTLALIDLTLRAVDGGVSRSVAALARGVFPMALTSKKTVATIAAVFALAGLGVALGRPASQPPDRPASGEKRPVKPTGAAKAGPAKSGEVHVTGRVLGPDGLPVPGANLYSPRAKTPEPRTEDDIEVLPVGEAGEDGRFAVTIPAPGGRMRSYLIAHAPGFGVDWVEFGERGDARPDAEQTLRLSKDVPITGRVLNTEGQPVAGVRVSALAIHVPAGGKLDDYLAGWMTNLRDTLSTPRKRLYVPLDAITGRAVADADGRFTVRGAGSERVV